MGFLKDYFRYREARRQLLILQRTADFSSGLIPVSGRPYKILVVAYDALGDFILSTPAFKLLIESYPGSQIEVICSIRNAELAEAYGFFHRVHRVQLNGPGSAEDERSLQFLANEKFDFVLNLFDEPDEFAIVKILSLKKTTSGFFSLPLRFKSRWQLKMLKGIKDFSQFDGENSMPFADRILKISEILDLKRPTKIIYDFPKFEKKTRINSSGKIRLLWSTIGSQRANTLDPQRIRSISELIQQNSNVQCFVFENAHTELITKLISEVIVLKSSTIVEAGSYIEQMDMVLTTDTATAHLATIFNVPVLVMRVNTASKAAFDPLYGVNQVVVSATSKLSGLDLNLLNSTFTKMIAAINVR